MDFKKFTAGKLAYGTDSIPVEKQESNVCFSDPNLKKILNN
jgi:hypothetical protein